MPSTAAPQAIVMYANHAVLAASYRLVNPLVRSRMLVWCRHGSGTIRINGGLVRDFSAGAFAWLPWAHRVEYQAGRKAWHLGGIHIVPRFPYKALPDWRIRHQQAEPDAPNHADAPLPQLDGTCAGVFHDAPGLEELAEFVVAWFRSPARDAAGARRLAGLVCDHLAFCLKFQPAARQSMPHFLRAIMDFVRTHLADRFDMATLSRLGDCSAATVCRQFMRHTGFTPMLWIQRERMLRAAELLDTTMMRVGDVGIAVGVPDPYYFSRLFRTWLGTPPSARRKRALL